MGSNLRFDMSVIFMVNYSFSGSDVPVDSETFLVTDSVNLKIKPVQSFGYAYKGKVFVRVFIGMSARTCMRIYVCTIFLKDKNDVPI
jgi:hypothetical protein